MKKFALALLFALASQAWAAVIFTETMGTVGGTTTIAVHEAANGFDNDAFTMDQGSAANAADLRATNVSTGAYVGASGGANVFLTAATERGFAIKGINASAYTGLTLKFGFRKDTAALAIAGFDVEYATDGGTVWTPLTVTGYPAAGDATGWYLISGVSLPPAAQVSNLALRWRKTSTTIAIRLDDIVLEGTPAGNDYGVSPGALSALGRDTADGAVVATAVITATNSVDITNVALTGSGNWSYSGTAFPFTVTAGTTAALTFTYTPVSNSGAVDATTATLSATGTPASFAITLSGSTVKEVPLAQFKSEAEAGTAGSTVYKITNAIVNSNGVQGTRNQVPVQDEATGSASTRGIWIDDVTGTGKGPGSLPAAGSTLTIWGTYTNSRGLVQFVPTKAYQVTATGATVVPYTTSGAGLGDATEGVLVTIPNTVVPVGSYDSTVASVNVTVSDGTSFVARLLNSAAITYTGTGLPYPLTGVAAQFNSTATNPNTGGDGYQVFPRSSADVPVELSSFDAE